MVRNLMSVKTHFVNSITLVYFSWLYLHCSFKVCCNIYLIHIKQHSKFSELSNKSKTAISSLLSLWLFQFLWTHFVHCVIMSSSPTHHTVGEIVFAPDVFLSVCPSIHHNFFWRCYTSTPEGIFKQFDALRQCAECMNHQPWLKVAA